MEMPATADPEATVELPVTVDQAELRVLAETAAAAQTVATAAPGAVRPTAQMATVVAAEMPVAEGSAGSVATETC